MPIVIKAMPRAELFDCVVGVGITGEIGLMGMTARFERVGAIHGPICGGVNVAMDIFDNWKLVGRVRV